MAAVSASPDPHAGRLSPETTRRVSRSRDTGPPVEVGLHGGWSPPTAPTAASSSLALLVFASSLLPGTAAASLVDGLRLTMTDVAQADGARLLDAGPGSGCPLFSLGSMPVPVDGRYVYPCRVEWRGSSYVWDGSAYELESTYTSEDGRPLVTEPAPPVPQPRQAQIPSAPPSPRSTQPLPIPTSPQPTKGPPVLPASILLVALAAIVTGSVVTRRNRAGTVTSDDISTLRARIDARAASYRSHL